MFKFCCLGVACEIAIENGLPLGTSTNRLDSISTKFYFNPKSPLRDISYLVLPRFVMEYYGFDDADPKLIDTDGNEVKTTKLNDTIKYDFEAIACTFERTYLRDDPESKGEPNENKNRE